MMQSLQEAVCEPLHDSDILHRGWVTRKGHLRRLHAPKSWKHNVSAWLHDQDAAARCGRAVFRRSVNNGSRNHWRLRNKESSHNHFLHLARADAADELHEYLWGAGLDNSSIECGDWEFESWDEQETDLAKPVVAPCEGYEKQWADALEEDCGSTASLTSWAHTEDYSVPSSSSDMSWESEPNRALHKSHRWHEAVARAEAAANLFASASLARRKTKKKRPYSRLSAMDRSLAQELNAKYDICMSERDLQSSEPFEAFRKDFLRQHCSIIGSGLRRCMPESIILRPTPLADNVKEQFLHACQGGLQGKLVPTCHGTSESNLQSIFNRGLLIPGCGNGLRVVNGSAHGLGVYTARAGNPSLAWGYSRGATRHLLVCGVLDDLEEHPERSNIKHCGDAIVIFDHMRVAPLFDACGNGMPTSKPWSGLQQQQRQQQQQMPLQQRAMIAQEARAKISRARRSRLRPIRSKRKNDPTAFLARRAAQTRRGH